ncbi:sigma-54-dependent Fis family transcriptional regulator [bacterium]|nr:sigma-54-dependent Fis family transcriptional regulator [bacterium]
MKILIADDEINIVKLMKEIFEEDNHEIEIAYNGQQALDKYKNFVPDITFLDVKMPVMDGVSTLEKIKQVNPEALIVMISGHSNISIAVKSIKGGAYDFLEKPLSLPLLKVTLNKAIQYIRTNNRIANLQSNLDAKYQMIGSSQAMKKLNSLIDKVAHTNSKVLIQGESGTGKELVAWSIHSKSCRAEGSFIRFNSAAIPNELVESELFGFEKGAFTGAHNSKKGKIEEADGGTLFLDEIGDMSLTAQAKILRVIQEGEFERVGSNKSIKVDARIIAATHKNLEELISEGKFREDLYYRLNVIPLRVPPLRERNEDIEILVNYFSELNAQEMKIKPKEFTPETINYLTNLNFAGNVRELKNLIERLYIVSDNDLIELDFVKSFYQPNMKVDDFWDETINFADKKAQFEKRYLEKQLWKHACNISKTSQSLGLQQSNLSRKIKELGINFD